MRVFGREVTHYDEKVRQIPGLIERIDTSESGALIRAFFGLNKSAPHHYHSTYREARGMKPLLNTEDVA